MYIYHNCSCSVLIIVYLGTCIVLSGMGDRAFVTNRGCVDKMSLSWFKPRIEETVGINHFHSSGYFNCTTIRSELPVLFRHVRATYYLLSSRIYTNVVF